MSDGSDYEQYDGRTQPSRSGYAYRRADAGQHHERHAEARARADAQHVGASQRIAEQGLHLKAANRQRRPGQQSYNRLYQPYVQDDFRRSPRAVAARQCRPYVADGNANRAHSQIQQEEADRKHGQRGE